MTIHHLRPGPRLPYDVIAGGIPCEDGWLVASAKLQGATMAPEQPRMFESFMDVLDERPAFAVVALYAPVGLLDQTIPGGRTCEREARALLGAHLGGSVRSAPSRSAFTGEL